MSPSQSPLATRVLYLGADEVAAAQIERSLSTERWCDSVVSHANPAAALAQLNDLQPSCVVVSDNLPSTDCVALAENIRDEHPDLPLVLFVNDGSEALASRAVSAGVTEYVRATDGTEYRGLVECLENLLDTADPSTATQHDRNWVEEFLELFPGVVFKIDADGTYTDLLSGDEESLLYDEAAELLERRFDEVLPAETAQRFHEVVRTVLDTGERQRLEYQLDVQAGQRWFEAQVGPADDPATVFWVARDITERKRRKQEYEQIYNSVNDAIAVFHPDTAEILDVNTAYRDMVGYESLDRIQELGIDGLSATDEGYTEERGREIIQAVSRHGEPETVEWRIERQSGERIWVEVTITTAKINGSERVLTIQRDITERKRREREYEQIFNGVQDAIAIIDPETHEMVEVNDTFCEMVGYERDALFDQGIEGLSATDDGYTRDRAETFIDDVLDAGEARSYEWVLETSTGDKRVIEVVGTTAQIGGELRYISINRDITERKRRKREFEQIFNSVNDAIAVHDPETYEILETNQTMCELTGYDEDTLIEMGAEELVVADPAADYGPDDVTTIIDKIAAGTEMEPYEQVIETSDGEQIWLEVNPTRAEINGEPRVLALSRDITRRKRREREYKQLFDSVMDAICIIDPDTMEILDANGAYLDMLGYETLSELQQQGIDGLSNTADGFASERGAEIHDRAADRGEPERTEWQAETSDGERLWLDVKVAPAQIGGQSVNVVFHRDITDRKHRQQRLEVFNRVLRHNLRNEVDVINSHAELLQQQTDGEHAEQITDAANRLVTLGQRARSIDQILSRPVNVGTVNLADRIDCALQQVDEPDRDVEVRVSVPDSATVESDGHILQVVVESALDNAISHARSTVEVIVQRKSRCWLVEISDDGPGLPQQELNVLETGTETDLQHSRGLDMWRLNWGVEKLNGYLEFDTADGTTVRITVPDQNTTGD